MEEDDLSIFFTNNLILDIVIIQRLIYPNST